MALSHSDQLQGRRTCVRSCQHCTSPASRGLALMTDDNARRHTHTRMCTLSLNSPWCWFHHINPPCVHVFKNSLCWWWTTPSRGLTPDSIRKDSRWAIGLISAACVLLWLTLTAPLCSDALLKVSAAYPGRLRAARRDICCSTTEQIQEQKGMNLF